MRIINIFFLPISTAFLNKNILPKLYSLKKNTHVKDYSKKINLSTRYKNNIKNEEPYNKIVNDVKKMSLPLLVIWFSNPLLSLVDTISVGKVSSITELASLGPATALCDTGGNIFSFISIVTTCRVAKEFAKKDEKKMTHILNDSFIVSFLFGIIISISMFNSLGINILKLFLGNPGDLSEASLLIPGAMKYIKIRAIGYIPSLMTSQLQSYAIAKRNVKMPLKTVALSTLINIVTDYILVIHLKFGLVGAAWATVLAQISSFFYMLSYLIQEKKTYTDCRIIKVRIKELILFLKQCGGPAISNIGRAGILISTSSLCSGCGTVSVAAHQIILSWFYLFCPIGEAVSQTVMNLLPSYLHLKNKSFTKDTQSFVSTMSKVALFFGVIDACSVVVPAYLPNLFTHSLEVSNQIHSLSPYLLIALFTHVIACFFEGILFAMGDTNFLAVMYSLNMIIVASLHNILTFININTLWMIYVFSIIARSIEFSFRFYFKYSKG
tara:strand:- start:808 stop:2295 length:1488 start_codon:yes stop_codon:yes gene_type:complete